MQKTTAPHALWPAKYSKPTRCLNRFLIALGPEQHCCRRCGQNFEDWRINQSIRSRCGNENRHGYCPGSSRTRFCRVRFEPLFVFHSDAPPPPTLAGDFTKPLFLSHYLHVVAVFQMVDGLLLVIGRLVSLGLVLLAPSS